MSKIRTILGAFALTCIAGCAQILGGLDDPKDGGSDAATTPDTDASTQLATVSGISFAVGDAVGFYDDTTAAPGIYSGFVISTDTGLCSRLINSNAYFGEIGIFVLIYSPAAPTVGKYSIIEGNFEPSGSAQAEVEQFPISGVCSAARVTGDVGLSGTVTFTSITSTELTGTYDIKFVPTQGETAAGPADNQTVTGSFDVPICGGITFGDLTGGATCRSK